MNRKRTNSRVSSQSSRSSNSVPMRTLTRSRISHEIVKTPLIIDAVEKDRPTESKLERMLRLTSTKQKNHMKERSSSLSHRVYEDDPQIRSVRRLESSIDGKKSETWFKGQGQSDSIPQKYKNETISYDIDPRLSETSKYN